MADLMVSMGIEDRGIRRGLQTAEAMVHRSQQNMGRRGLFGDDSGILRTEKGLNKIAGTLTGLPLKLGALGAAFYAFKNGAEYLREFEQILPYAERGMERLSESIKRFKESWAIDMNMGASGGLAGWGAKFVDDASEFRKDATQAIDELYVYMYGNDDRPASDNPAAARKAKEQDLEMIRGQRKDEIRRVKQRELEAELAAAREDKYAADLAAAEARRSKEELELRKQARDDGFQGSELAFERAAIRKRFDAAIEKANREKKQRDDDAAEKQAQDERNRLEERNKATWKAAEDSLRIERDRVRSLETGAVSAEDKLNAKREQAHLDFAERIAELNRRVREDGLDKAGFMRLSAPALELRDAEIRAAEAEYAKVQGDAARAETQKREGAMIDAQELRAQVAAAKARTEEEKKVARELELQAKFRRDEAILKSQGLDPDVERMLLEERRNLLDAELDAELGAAGRDRGRRGDVSTPGLDLSSAGAVASQGQAFAFSIPGKIDRTNALLQQANQTLREIKQGQGDGARFA